MPLLFIHARNSGLQFRDDGVHYDGPEAALASGVRGAMDIAAEEIAGGQRSAAVEVIIERADGAQVLRSVVAISVSPLITTDMPPSPAAG